MKNYMKNTFFSKKWISFFSLLLCFLMLFSSCKKEAGEGGTSAIKGKLKVLDYDWNPNNNKWELTREYYGPNTRVFIIYGDDEIYSDDFRTDAGGNYRFQGLRKGSYTIFAFSDDTTGNVISGIESVEIEVEITKNKQEVTTNDLQVIN